MGPFELILTPIAKNKKIGEIKIIAKIEKLTSKNTDDSKFHDLYFFRPEIILTCQNSKITFHYYDGISSKVKIESIFYKIINYQNNEARTEKNVKIKQISNCFICLNSIRSEILFRNLIHYSG